ncbi:unnamed protein product [Chrysodeixis includens]|uniref:Uncharacterized protein n=1 Tax=Chrysodeixis includens TaxID=689277 RepID=A0A9N8PYD2_CHRIL|nr:unnamed protein product [Chrysodeixis includens]
MIDSSHRSVSQVSARAQVMFSAAVLLVACAATAAIDPKTFNTTAINKQVLQKLSPILNSNITLNERELAFLNRTVQNLGVDKDLVAKLTGLVNLNGTLKKEVSKVVAEAKSSKSSSYDAYGDEIGNNDGNVRHVEESPDYASSVVLASDLLSLTSAVASVKDTVCREQGYKFLDGLIMNKRWALKSKYCFNSFFNKGHSGV